MSDSGQSIRHRFHVDVISGSEVVWSGEFHTRSPADACNRGMAQVSYGVHITKVDVNGTMFYPSGLKAGHPNSWTVDVSYKVAIDTVRALRHWVKTGHQSAFIDEAIREKLERDLNVKVETQ